MTRCYGIGQTLIVGSVIWGVCSIPSCVLVPLNTILRYLACVVLYPDVRLTWSGIVSCFPDLRVLLQTRVCVSLLILYLIVWWLWPGRDRVYMVLKPPVCTFKKGYDSWLHFLEYTRTCLNWVIYQQGLFAWSDAQWLRSVSFNKHGVPNRQTFHPGAIHKFLRKSVWQTGPWWKVSNKVYHLHVRVHALIWRVTSYHVQLHMRIWLLVIEWMFCRFVSNRVLCGAGTHLDVLKQHKVKFLLIRQLPLRIVSRWWGRVNQIDLPVWLRGPVCRLYIRVFEVNLEEAERTDLTYYRNMSQFFRRSLKPHLRRVDKAHCMTSPVDGRILHLGKIENGLLEQVKDVTYSLSLFMGQDYNFMEAFVSRKTLLSTKKASEHSVQYQQTANNFAFRADIHSGELSGHHDCMSHSIYPFTNILGPIDRATQFEIIPSKCDKPLDPLNSFSIGGATDGETRNVFEGNPRIQMQSSSYTKNPISLSNSSQSLSDQYQVEEHIFEQVFAIEENDLLAQQDSPDCNKTQYLNFSPDLEFMSSAVPSGEKEMLLQREAAFAGNLLVNPDHVLHQCIIYLAPGDYHRFHSPVDWTVYHRRHFTGDLISVNPSIAKWLQGLFTINERVLYVGRWKYGFFSMTPVGATNVGTINVFFDQKLRTNSPTPDVEECIYSETSFRSRDQRGVSLKRGQLIGDFNLGSTIVLLFEAPADFKLRHQPGDRVKYGQGMTTMGAEGKAQRRKRYKRKMAQRKK